MGQLLFINSPSSAHSLNHENVESVKKFRLCWKRNIRTRTENWVPVYNHRTQSFLFHLKFSHLVNCSLAQSWKSEWIIFIRLVLDLGRGFAYPIDQGWANFYDRGPHSASLGPWRAAFIFKNQVKIRGSYMYFYRGCGSIWAEHNW